MRAIILWQRKVLSRIISWLPEDGEDPALWRARHVDGDHEDLELHELLDDTVPLGDTESTAAQNYLNELQVAVIGQRQQRLNATQVLVFKVD